MVHDPSFDATETKFGSHAGDLSEIEAELIERLELPLGSPDQSFLGLIFCGVVAARHSFDVGKVLAEVHRRRLRKFAGQDPAGVRMITRQLLGSAPSRDIAWVDWSLAIGELTEAEIDRSLGALNTGRSRLLDGFRGVILVLPPRYESRLANSAVDLWSIRTFTIRVAPTDATSDAERFAAEPEPYVGPTRLRMDDHGGDYRARLGQIIDDVAVRERVLGVDHPDTLASRNNLAYAYESAGDLGRAIPLYEQTLADRERVLGSDHPTTLAVRANLARLTQGW